MYTNNPYAQAGWSNPANQHTINTPVWTPDSLPPPSIFGALPFSSTPSTPARLCFHFTSFNPTILNCTVVGPQMRPYFYIVTQSAARTLIRNREGREIAAIGWGAHPMVEITGACVPQPTGSFLRLSPDGRCRYVRLGDKPYIWELKNKYLYSSGSGPSPPELLARLVEGQGVTTLEMTTAAIQLGLLEVSVVATVLMQSSREID